MSPQGWRRLHLVMAIFWSAMIVPTVLWWHDSILWVAGCSLYANAATHMGAWQASRAEVATVEAQDAVVTADHAEVNVRADS